MFVAVAKVIAPSSELYDAGEYNKWIALNSAKSLPVILAGFRAHNTVHVCCDGVRIGDEDILPMFVSVPVSSCREPNPISFGMMACPAVLSETHADLNAASLSERIEKALRGGTGKIPKTKGDPLKASHDFIIAMDSQIRSILGIGLDSMQVTSAARPLCKGEHYEVQQGHRMVCGPENSREFVLSRSGGRCRAHSSKTTWHT